MTATIENSMQLRWWLKGYGERVEVLEPLELRDEFRGMFLRLRDMYQ